MTSRRRYRSSPLRAAVYALTDAIADLCEPRHVAGTRVASRYAQLRDAVDIAASRAGTGTGSNRTPCWLDALKLAIRIDARTAEIRATPTRSWRPQDIPKIEQLTTEIGAWCKAIDDLFSIKPIYLPNPCPRCDQRWTHRLNDEGERTRTPALALTAERGAWCQACHDRWEPERLPLLARQLGTMPATVGNYRVVV
jgi:hypothetical protein